MKNQNGMNRKALKSKMAEALDSHIKTLSAEMKDILLDDLITALESRVKALNEAPSDVKYIVDVEMKVSQ